MIIRKSFIITLLSVILTGVISSCVGENKKGSHAVKGNDITFDSVVVDTVAFLLDKKDSPYCSLRISMQYAKGKNADAINNSILRCGILAPDYFSLTDRKLDIKHAVDSFVTTYIADYKESYGDIYKQEPENKSLNTSYNITAKANVEKEGLIAYTADIVRFDGGMHDIEQTIVRNIDIATGKVLMLKDVFVKGSERRLSEAIVKQLAEDKNMEGIEELNKQFIFAGIEPYASENFILGEDDITFIYCSDEIAPHALGEIRVVIPYNDVKELMIK